MLTVMMSVFAFAQEIQQTPLPGLKKQLTAKQQALQAKRQGLSQQEATAQFNFKKATLPQSMKKNRPVLNLPVQKMEGGKKAQTPALKNFAGKAKAPRRADLQAYTYSFVQALNGWTEIDADGDGNSWYLGTADGHDGEPGLVTSASYAASGALNPDNYLVSPKMKLDGKITFYACAQDASYPSEHFGVAVSTTSGTDATAFTMVSDEWTMTAAPVVNPSPLAKGPFRSTRRAQGNWYEFTVDLSSFAGAEGYVAIRHFNCSDWFRLNVDDITLETSQLIDAYDPTLEVAPEKVVLPEGAEVKPYYVLDGTLAVYTSSGWSDYTKKVKNINVAFVGTDAYIQGLAYWQQESWVKGTVADNKITIPSGQYVGDGEYLNGMDNTGAWLESYSFTVDTEAGTITSTDYIGESESATKNSLYSYWITPSFTLTEPADPRVIPPTDLQTEAWTMARYFYNGSSESGEEKVLQVGFYTTETGTDVYVNGMSEYMTEDAWIKGTLSEDGKSITFASGQYYGELTSGGSTYDLWFAGADITTGALVPVTVAYDAEAGTMTWPDYYSGTVILENGEEDQFYAFGYFTEIVATVRGTAPEPIAAPDIVTTEWYFKAVSLVSEQDAETGETVTTEEEYTNRVQVGIAGTDVFVKGIAEDLPDAWIKGTLDPETKKVTFPTGQHIGTEVFWVWSFEYFFAGHGANGFEDVVMAYDAEAKTLTMESPMFLLINGAWLMVDPNLILADVTMQEIQDIAVAPAQPEIVASRLSGTSYPNISVEIPDLDVNGNPLLTSKLTYQYWTEIDGVQAPLTLDPAEYPELTEAMTEIPYDFSDNWDIYNYRLYLNQDFSTWKKIGIQSIYRGGEAENKSAISWKTIANFSVDENFDSSKGGISLNTKALEGETVKVYVLPDNGYKVTKVTARVGKTNIKVGDPVEEVDDWTGEVSVYYPIIAPPADVIVNAEFDVTPADFSLNVPAGSNINEYIEAQTQGMMVRGLSLWLEAGEYTMTKPIEAAGMVEINGEGDETVIDASGIVGGEDGSASAPFIQLSTTPLVGFAPKYDGSGDTDYYLVSSVLINHVYVKGLKNSIFWDNNTKYVVENFQIWGSKFELATDAVQNEALISFQAGGAKDLNILQSTFVGNNAVAKYFVRYNNSARLDRYGYDKNNDYQTMTYTNNTFYGLLIADGQWGNYNGISGQMYSKFDIQNNIWFNCGKNIIRRLAGGRFNGANPMTFKNNTYFNNDVDESAGETDYDKSGTILTTDPKFEDAANGDFSVRTKTEQAVNQTGDWNRWGEWIVDLYEITVDVAEDANGEVKAPQYAQENEEVELEVIPAQGYRLVEGSLKVFLGKSEIELDGTKFSMPAANVTVKAEFELIPVFAVTVAADIENGTVTADKQEAAEGEVVKLTITPAEGFELDYITVTGVNTNIAVPVEDNQFTMPADAVNINAAFKATATGIQAIAVDKLDNATIYTLQGVRVEKTQITKGGVYIVNGKKVAIK